MSGNALTEEQRRRKNMMDRERRRKNKDEINAKDRERRKRKKDSMTAEEKKAYNEKAAKRMRLSRANRTPERKQEELTANRVRISKRREGLTPEEKQKELTTNSARMRKFREAQTWNEKQAELATNSLRMQKRRKNQTPDEKQEELTANNIRNALAHKIPGSRVKLFIQRVKPDCSAEEKLQIIAHRNMLMTKHALPTMQKRVSLSLARVNHLRDAQERASVGFEEGRLSERYTTVIFKDLQKAIDQHASNCAEESERQSMCDLARAIFHLSTIDPNHPDATKEHLIAKRSMLQVGYNLSLSQRTYLKTAKIAQKAKEEYESKRSIGHYYQSEFAREFQINMQRIAGWKKHLGPSDSMESIAKSEIFYKSRFEERKKDSASQTNKYKRRLKEANDKHREAVLRVEELQKELASATEISQTKWDKHATFLDPDDDELELMRKEQMDASGWTCRKCKHMWFYNINAADDHETLCKGLSTSTPEPVNPAKASTDAESYAEEPNKSLTEEDVASDFIHPKTGQYRSIEDGVPDHIDPKTGYYKYGVRKCSKCNRFKDRHFFTAEEAETRADSRVCICCMEEEESVNQKSSKCNDSTEEAEENAHESMWEEGSEEESDYDYELDYDGGFVSEHHIDYSEFL